jgi:hypothetical protein
MIHASENLQQPLRLILNTGKLLICSVRDTLDRNLLERGLL